MTRPVASVALIAALATAAGCSGSSATSPPISAPPSARGTVVPALSVPAGAHPGYLTGTAIMQTPAGLTVHLATDKGAAADDFATAAGGITAQIAMSGSRDEMFNLSGPARTGAPLTNERISMLGPRGLYVDTTQPGMVRCSTTFTTATATSLAGSVTCKLLAATGTVNVSFHVG